MQLVNDFLNLLISPAFANEATQQAAGYPSGGYSLAVMTIIFILFMYFVMWRPQSRRAKEHRELMGSLAKGDEVVTAGGILGRVAKITDAYLIIALTDQVEIAIQKSSIVNVLPKGTLKSIN